MIFVTAYVEHAVDAVDCLLKPVDLASQPPVMIWRTLAHFESLLPAPPPPASAKRWPPSGAADLDEHRHGWDRATPWRS